MACAMNIDTEPQVDGDVASHFFTYAQQIDSSLHPHLMDILKVIKMLNSFSKALGKNEIIAVGSCVDGSKVRTPEDGGDVDILLIANVLLDQSQFVYDKRYPSFLKVLVTEENKKYFHGLELVDEKYLTVSSLKDLKLRFYLFVKSFVQFMFGTGVSKNEKYLEMKNHTAVGHEHVKLDLTPFMKLNSKLQDLKEDEDVIIKDFMSRLIHTVIDTYEMQTDDKGLTDDIVKSISASKNADLSQAINRLVNLIEGGDANTPNSYKIAEKSNKDKQELCFGEIKHKRAVNMKQMQASVSMDDNIQTEKILYCRNERLRNSYKITSNVKNSDHAKDITASENDNTRTFGLQVNNYPDIAPDTRSKGSTKSLNRGKEVANKHMAEIYEPSQYNLKEDKCVTKNTPSIVISKYCDLDNSVENSKHENENAKDTDCAATRQMHMANRLLSTDFVPAFRFKGWPSIANEWISRQRMWPSNNVAQSILETGCQIVAKRPLFPWLNGDPKNEDHSPEHDMRDTYFRVSFSCCEVVLSKSLNKFQLLVWRILKAYQKAYLGTTPRVLASYHWKNVVFWVFEETTDDYWTENNVLAGLCKALDFMLIFLRLKFVPMYFVRTCNLIDGCREDKILLVLEKVQVIRRNPFAYLKEFLNNPPCAEQQTVDLAMLNDCINRSNAEQFVESTLDNFCKTIANFPSACEHFNMQGCFPLEFKNIFKTILEIVNENGGYFPTSSLPFLDLLKNTFANSLLDESLSLDFDNMKKSLGKTLDAVTPLVSEEHKGKFDMFSKSFKTIISCSGEDSEDTDERIRTSLKGANSTIISLIKSERKREQENRDIGTKTTVAKPQPIEKVLDSFQNAFSTLIDSKNPREARRSFGNLIRTVADNVVPKSNIDERNENQEMDIDLD